jgi:23S rRNA (uracil1939-C5)-methyltransferase
MPRKPSLPKQTFTATVETLTHEGRGLAHCDGKAVFLENALPGEIVEFVYTKIQSRYAEGDVTKVITPSPERVEPPCEHFTICGGCSLQHMSAASQIELKQNTLLEQLHHFGQIKAQEILPPLTADTLGYRRKARLGVRYVEKKQRLLIGFREKKGRFLADLKHCLVLDPRVGELITPLSELISTLTVMRDIAQIEVAMGDKDVALVFRNLKPLAENDEQKIIDFASQHQVKIYMQPGGIETIYLLQPQTPVELNYQLPDFGITIDFDPLDFTQVNQPINQKMVKLAVELLELTKEDNVLDLFCGLGNFSLAIAKKAASVVGVEGDAVMVRKATDNARRNNISNVSFFEADLFKPISDQPWFSQGFSKILLDPPRSGALEVVSTIEKWSPQRIVYVSCNPATLARDAGILVNEKKYRLVKAGVMDMFPHTAHVESIALFEKR